MTRLKHKLDPDHAFDLAQAFRLLGPAPSWRELAWVVDALREGGVEVIFDEALEETAVANGSSAFVALDLDVAMAFGVEALTAGPRRRPTCEGPD